MNLKTEGRNASVNERAVSQKNDTLSNGRVSASDSARIDNRACVFDGGIRLFDSREIRFRCIEGFGMTHFFRLCRRREDLSC